MSRSTCIADRRQTRERLRSVDERETSLKGGRRRNTKKKCRWQSRIFIVDLAGTALLLFFFLYLGQQTQKSEQLHPQTRKSHIHSVDHGSPSKWRRMILAYGRRCKCTASKPTLDVTPPTRHERNKKKSSSFYSLPWSDGDQMSVSLKLSANSLLGTLRFR